MNYGKSVQCCEVHLTNVSCLTTSILHQDIRPMNFLDIQSWWEIPCIAHFCSLFSSALKLPEFEIEDLEEALLADGTDGTPDLVPILIVSLLKGCVQNPVEISTSNYQMFLRRIFRRKCEEYNIENTFNSDIDFQSLPLQTKILNLHLLCDFRLDSDDIPNIFNQFQSDSLRVTPLGFDSRDSTYWYFYGTRLYREDKLSGSTAEHRPVNASLTTKNRIKSITSPGCGGVWQVICFTEEDWHNLATKFKSSKNTKERDLYKTLNDDFLPEIPRLFRKKELLRRRQLMKLRNTYAQRRTSSRLINKKSGGEEDSETVDTESENSHPINNNNSKRRFNQLDVITEDDDEEERHNSHTNENQNPEHVTNNDNDSVLLKHRLRRKVSRTDGWPHRRLDTKH